MVTMFDFDQTSILSWLSSYAYEPTMVYLAIVLLLTASSFGLPVPEEVTLISVGLIAYLSANPEKFPPPYPGAEPVQLSGLMLVTFFAVFLSDFLVFLIGRFWGNTIRSKERFKKFVTSGAIVKAEEWTKKYGAIMCGVFRFTPGLRFPGHMMCGALKVPPWKFCLVDGLAALLSVPTQVWLVATYGDFILSYIKQFKMLLLVLILMGLALFFMRKSKWIQQNIFKKSANSL